MNRHDDDWKMDELWREVLDENLRRFSENDADYDDTMRAYNKHSDIWWTGHTWAWRIAFVVVIALLIAVSFTDKRAPHTVVPSPAAPTTVVTR